MFKIQKEEIDFGGQKLILETGKIARQADGAIIAKLGETVVIATAVGAKKLNEGQDYFPLSVNYQEKYYAAGKIPGGYFKREARPTEAETLISRLIDRPIRPLFPSSFMNEVQLLPTVLSYDGENQPDVLSIIASSAALAISGLPFQGPIAASRVGYKDGKYLLNPSINDALGFIRFFRWSPEVFSRKKKPFSHASLIIKADLGREVLKSFVFNSSTVNSSLYL